jgi:hypothetical protein
MDFRILLSGRGWLHYAAFDLLWLNGRDLRGLPLIKRKRRLEQLIPANNSTLSRVLAVESMGASYSRRPSGWIWRGLWRNGKLTRTRRRQFGISQQSSLHPGRG